MTYLKRHVVQDLPSDHSISPFFVLASQSSLSPYALLEGIKKGWCHDFNEQLPNEGMTLLMNVLAHEHWDELEVRRYQGNSSLTTNAIRTPLTELAIEMIERGANPWTCAKESQNMKQTCDSFDQAMHAGQTFVIEECLTHKDAPAVSELMKRGVSSGGANYIPYLHAAVVNQKFELVDILLKHGFDLEQKDYKGQTPLFYAISNESLEALLKRGANPVAQDNDGQLATQKWKNKLTPAISNEMIRTLQPAMIDNLSKMPEEQRWPLVRERTIEILEKGQKGALVSLLSGANLNLKDVFFPSDDLNKNPESLLFKSSIALLGDPTIAFHTVALAIKDQYFYETIKGIPDIFWAAQALSKASDRKGLDETKQMSWKILEKLKPQIFKDGKVDLKIMQLWVTLAAMNYPHRALISLKNVFLDEQKSFFPGNQVSVEEQEKYGLNNDWLVFQFYQYLSEKELLDNQELIENVSQSIKNSKKIDEVFQQPTFWNLILADIKTDSPYLYHIGYFWDAFLENNIEAPIGVWNKEKISDLLETSKNKWSSRSYGSPNKTSSVLIWMEKWLLTESITENKESNAFKAPKKRI